MTIRHWGIAVKSHFVDARLGKISQDDAEAWLGRQLGWQRARERAAKVYPEKFGRQVPEGFRRVRIHDLKHTFGRRLRASGVNFETRQVLLGHHNGSVTTHYSAAEIAELLEAVNRINATRSTPAMTLLRAVA